MSWGGFHTTEQRLASFGQELSDLEIQEERENTLLSGDYGKDFGMEVWEGTAIPFGLKMV